MMLGSLQDLMGGFQNFGVDGTTELLAQMLSDPSMLPGGDFAQLGMNAAQQGMPMFGDQIAMMQQGIDPFINDRLSYFANQGAWDHAIKPANRMIDLGEDATGFARNLMSGGPQFDYGFNNFGLTDFMGGYRSSPYTESVIGGLQSDAQRFLGENALRRDREQAIQTGQYGGSRGEIAEGISERGVGEEFLQQAAALRDQDYARYLSNKLQAGQQLTSADIQAQQVGAQRGGIGADYGINVGNLMNQLIGTGGQIGSTYAGLVGDIEASRMGQGIGQQGNTANAIANYLQAGQGMYGTGWDSLLGLGTLGTQLGQVGNQANQINQQGLQMGMEGIPALFAMMMGQGDLLRNIGTRDQALNQRFIDSDVNRWNYQQNAPMDLINNWANILNGVQATPNQTQTKNQLGALDYALAFAGGGDDSPLSTIAKIFG